MRRRWIGALLTAALGACQSTLLALPTDEEIAASADIVVDPQEIIVTSPSWTSARQLISKARPLGYRLKAEDELAGLDTIMLTLLIPEGQDGGSAIRELESLANGITAGVNHGYAVQAQAVPETHVYAAQLMNWDPVGCAAQLKIGVLDTAADPSLAKRHNVEHADFSRSSTSTENTSHGTSVLELMFTPGMLNDVSVLHADIVTTDDTLGDVASVDTMLRGLNWLIERDVKLINVSLAGPYNKILDRAYQRAEQKGVIVVAAAGNAGPDRSVQYPAAFASTLAVTAIDADLDINGKAVRGEALDFSAPGVDVLIGETATGQFLSGTSIAAPFVTLRVAGDPQATQYRTTADVRTALSNSALDLGSAGHDSTFGYGLITAPPPCQTAE